MKIPRIGSGTRTHLFTYRFDGAEWSLEIEAGSRGEALDRIKSLAFARYEGELVAKVPAVAGPFARFATWIRNAAQPG